MIPLGGPPPCPACRVLHTGDTCEGVLVVADSRSSLLPGLDAVADEERLAFLAELEVAR